MTAIENKELRGITGKLIYTIILSTTIIVSSGFGAYFGLKMDISAVKNQTELRQVEFDALKAQVNSIQYQLNELAKQQSKENR
ncbi:MAG: hypothetical protein WBP45_14675 [Daejeonella sp.]